VCFAVLRAVPTVSVDDVPGATLAGLKVIVKPFPDGEMLDLRVTVPVKPFVGVTVTVYVVNDPREIVCDGGVTTTVKFGGGGGAVGVADTSFDSVPVPALLMAATL